MSAQQLSKSRRIFIRRAKMRIRKNISDKKEQEKQITALYEKFGVAFNIPEAKEVIKDTTTAK